MKKKIRLFITALIVLITFLFINISKIKASTAINSYEEEQGLIVVGTYEKIEREEVLMKIQITEDMKEYYDEHNIPYITETRDLKLGFITIHTYEYYYTYVSYYDDVVSEKYVLKNDIQSVIYLVQVLEDFANDYIEEKRSEMENPPEETDIIRNRSINNKIDLIHMIASIDGVYDFTDNFIIELPSHFQRDLSNWAGDLQLKHDICFPTINEGTVTISGINKYNSRYRVSIIITII